MDKIVVGLPVTLNVWHAQLTRLEKTSLKCKFCDLSLRCLNVIAFVLTQYCNKDLIICSIIVSRLRVNKYNTIIYYYISLLLFTHESIPQEIQVNTTYIFGIVRKVGKFSITKTIHFQTFTLPWSYYITTLEYYSTPLE